MNVIKGIPGQSGVMRNPRWKPVYIEEWDAWVQEDLIPDILRCYDEKEVDDPKVIDMQEVLDEKKD